MCPTGKPAQSASIPGMSQISIDHQDRVLKGGRAPSRCMTQTDREDGTHPGHHIGMNVAVVM